MSILSIPHVALKGIASCVPTNEVQNMDYPYLSDKEKQFISKSIGINKRRIAPDGITASDLCFEAAQKLVSELAWSKDEINILVFVSQTPDYITPNTASVLQHRLGISQQCLAFDVNLGCSAYPYGLSIVAGLLQNMKGGKGLLLVGDKSSQLVSEEDKSAALLFSDAGSATALEYDDQAPNMWFDLCTDGSGAESLMVKGGAGRHPFHSASLDKTEESPGIIRSELNLILKGLDIFKFSVLKVPPSIRNILEAASVSKENVDYFVFHQANQLINKTISKKLGIDSDKVPQTLGSLGNSSSASIPVTLSSELHTTLSRGKHRLILAGFGVGLSWGTAIIETDSLADIPLIEL